LALCLPGHEDRNNSNKQKSRRYSCLGFFVFGHRALEESIGDDGDCNDVAAMSIRRGTLQICMEIPQTGDARPLFCPAGVPFGTPDSHYVMVRIIVRIFGAEMFSHIASHHFFLKVGWQDDCSRNLPSIRGRRKVRPGQGVDKGLEVDDAAEAES
jgi:hypothetical protein